MSRINVRRIVAGVSTAAAVSVGALALTSSPALAESACQSAIGQAITDVQAAYDVNFTGDPLPHLLEAEVAIVESTVTCLPQVSVVTYLTAAKVQNVEAILAASTFGDRDSAQVLELQTLDSLETALSLAV